MRHDMPGRGVPTAGTLRERRAVERQNREAVGFWGTVAGIREVRQTRARLADSCTRIQNNKNKPDEEDGSAKEASFVPASGSPNPTTCVADPSKDNGKANTAATSNEDAAISRKTRVEAEIKEAIEQAELDAEGNKTV